ncbi:MAG: Eco29kI family restriction endonuclease [Chloroflexi bacterium]|nr:Eco29kI family restriction endonuclease [Chloroflexota bacterium]MCI0578356.1 Eco29kI family restriction endonuclease [Chloroflexota bacterium]MCI0646241.1 Eco29kI family restriction endonuclease [Chloroflexota bacterium]MCI0732139.1 Eco29kI family restriction endonuclease [Chloroflexota bacterium]
MSDTPFDFSVHIFRSPKFRSVVREAIEFFMATPLHSVPPSMPFIGSGVYGLYYTGGLELYAPIAKVNRDGYVQPIYVGKAVPPGWRTARIGSSKTPDLYRRLREHARSIEQALNLQLEDFKCRFAILSDVEGDLVVPVEAELIRLYKPLWNMVIDGFGNHDPGSGRYNQALSEWDILHPGRLWASRLTGTAPLLENVLAKVERFLGGLPLS